MKLLILTAILAVSEAARLEKRFLNTFQPKRTGGLFSPFGSIAADSPAVPAGGYANDDLGIVVDAAAPGTRASGVTGLGGPRASYGSLDSKVGDAAFQAQGSGVKGAAGGIASLFGSGSGPKTDLGLSGIGVAPGSGSLDVPGINADGASRVKGVGVKKTTIYETIDSPDASGNAAIKGGAAGLGSLFGSSAGQSSLGFGATPGSSLDVSGIKGSGTSGVKGIGVTKTTYETIDTEREDAAIKSSASAVALASGFGNGQENIGFPGIGAGAASTSLDESALKTNDVSGVKSISVTKTTYETTDAKAGSAALGIRNTAEKESAIGAASLSGYDNGKANVGVAAIGVASESSSLDASGLKVHGESGIKGIGITKTKYESIESFDGDTELGIGSVAAKGKPALGSLFGSGAGQGNIGLTGAGFVPGFSDLDASDINTSGLGVTGLGVKKTTYESIDIKGKENEKASIDVVPSSDLEVPEIAPVGSIFGVSKATYESLEVEKGDASISSGAVGVSSLFGSGIDQETNIGLSGSNKIADGSSASLKNQGSYSSFPSVEVAKGSSSLDGPVLKTSEHTGVGIVTTEIISPGIENDKIHAQKFAHGFGINSVGETSGGAIISDFDTNPKTNAALPGIALISSSQEQSANKTAGAPSLGVSEFESSLTRVEGQGNDKIHAQIFANNVAQNANGESELNTRINSDSGAILNTGAQKVVPCTCSVSSELKTSAAEHAVGEPVTNEGTAGFPSSFGSSIKHESKAGLPSITVVPGIDSSVAITGFEGDKLHAQKFVSQLKEDNKDVPTSQVNAGTYDIQYNYKTGGSSYSGEKTSSSGIVTVGPNLVDQDLSSTGEPSVPVQGVQSWSSGGKVAITSGLHTTSTQEVNQDAVYHKTSYFSVHPSNEKSNVLSNQSSGSTIGSTSSVGIPNVNLQTDTSNGNSAYSEAVVEPSNGNLFNTGKLELVGQKIQDSNFGSFVLSSPSYYGNNVVYNRQKLTGHQGFTVSSTDSSSKINTADNSANSLNVYSNIPNTLTQSGQYHGLASSHYNDLNKASYSAFPSSITFGHLPYNLGIYESHNNLYNQQQQSQLNQYLNVKDNSQIIIQKENYKPNQILTGIKENHKNPFTQSNLNYVNNGQASSALHQSQSNSQYSQSAHSGFLNTISELPQAVDTLFAQKPGYVIMSSPPPSSETHLESTISGSEFVNEPLSSRIHSHFPTGLSQKPVDTFQIGSTYGSNQFGSAFNSVNNETLSHSQSAQFGVKPFDSSNTAGSIDSQSRFNKTQAGLSLQKVTISTTSTEVKPFTQSEVTTTNPQSSKVIVPDPTSILEISSGNKKIQFNSLSPYLHSENSKDSYDGTFKEQSLQTDHLGVKPFDLKHNTGTSFSQTQFYSQLGSQSGLNSQKESIFKDRGNLFGIQSQHITTNESNYAQKPIVVIPQVGSENKSIHFDSASVSSVHNENTQSAEISSFLLNGTSKVQAKETNQLGGMPFVISQLLNSSYGHTHSGHSSQNNVSPVSIPIATVQSSKQENKQVADSQFSQIPIQHIYSTFAPDFGKVPEPTVTTPHHVNTVNERTQLNSSSSSHTSQSENSQSISFSSKEQSVQSSEIGIKPIVLSHNVGSSSSPAQLNSIYGSQISRPTSSESFVATVVKPILHYVNKPTVSHYSQIHNHQSQDNSKSELTYEKEDSDLSQRGIEKEQLQFDSSSSILSGNKSESGIGYASTGSTGSTSIYNGATNEKPKDISFAVKPVELSHSSDTKLIQNHFGSDLNSQINGGLSNTQVTPISQLSSNPSGPSTIILNKNSQYGSQNKSKFGETPSRTTHIISGKENFKLDSLSTLTQNENLTLTHSSSLTDSINKDHSGVKPFETSELGIHSGSNSQNAVGTVLTSSSSDDDKRTTGLHSSQFLLQQSGFSSTSESHIKNKPESSFTSSHTFNRVGQKPTINTGYVKGNTPIASSLNLLNNEKSTSGEGNPSSYAVVYKEQSIQSSQFGIKPFSSTNPSQFTSGFENHYGLNDLNKKGIGIAQVSSEKSSEQHGEYNGNESSIYVKDISSTSVASKGQSTETSHLSLNEKPFVSSDKTASSQILSSSTTGYSGETSSAKGEKSDINSTAANAHIQSISVHGNKPYVSQVNKLSVHQSQITSTIGSKAGSDLESKGTLSNLSTVNGRETTGVLQTGTVNEKINFDSSSSSYLGDKPQTQSHSYSIGSSSFIPEKEIVELGLKPFEFLHTPGSSTSQTQFSEKSGSEYSSKPFGLQSSQSYQQGTQFGSLAGSDGLFGLTHSVQPYTYSKITGSGFVYPQSSFSLVDNFEKKPQTFTTTFSQVSQSPSGHEVKTPVDSVQSPFQNLFGLGTGQSYASSASSSASSSSFHTTQNRKVSNYQTTPYGTKGLQPFGEKYSELSSFVGKGEVFGGPRDPPSFDIKTGYTY